MTLLSAPFVGVENVAVGQGGYPPTFEGATEEVYKTVDGVELKLWVFAPDVHQPDNGRPAIVFFFGGGWRAGNPAQFEPHCRYLADRGMVAITADYRVASRHGVLADRCVADAKSAIRWVRQNASRLGIDPNRVAAGGGSAGGHLAAATATLKGLDEPHEDADVSSVPDAVVLFNPAVVLGRFDGVTPDESRLASLAERTGVPPRELSPIHHVRPGLPPTIIFHGEKDTTVPFATVQAYTRVCQAAGNRCELVGFPGAGHGFFNHRRGSGPDDAYTKTVVQLDRFLVSLGYLDERVDAGKANERDTNGKGEQGPEVVLTLPPGEGNPRNSEGDFIRLKDGRLLFIYTRFVGGSSDHDAASLVSRVSDDGGATWSDDDVPVLKNEGDWNVMSVSLLRLDDGRIAMFYLRKNSTTDCRPLVRFSDDEAKSWGEPVEIIPDDAIGYYVLNNDRVIELSGGRLVVPVALHHRPDWDDVDWKGEVMCFLSDDRGASWRRSKTTRRAQSADGKRVAAQEPGVIELRDGRLMMWVRTDAGEQFHSHSDDAGETWSALTPMGVASPQSPASIERIPEGDALLMVWNDHTDLPIEKRTLRTPLSVAVSRDEGKTWSPSRVIAGDPDGWYCYTAIEFAGDHVLLGHVAGKQAGGERLATTRITRVPIAWCTATAEREPIRVGRRAVEIHRSAPVIDGHNDLPWALRKSPQSFGSIDLRDSQPQFHTDIPRLRRGGVGAQFWSVYVPADTIDQGRSLSTTLEQIDLVERMVERYDDTFEIALGTDDIERIRGEGKIASLIGVEGGHSIENSINVLRELYDRGARYMTLTHSRSLDWADSCSDEPRCGGLSAFGEEVVREMNRLGMLVDISHVSPDCMRHTLRVSTAPIIFSHSSARGVADHPRNVPDDVLRMLPENGGVVMINFYNSFVEPEEVKRSLERSRVRDALREKFPDDPDRATAELRKWEVANPQPNRCTADHVVDHIERVIEVAGIDHVGLGSDYDGIPTVPKQLEDVASYPVITQGLIDRGYSEADIRKVLGGNLMRAFRGAEAVAAKESDAGTGGNEATKEPDTKAVTGAILDAGAESDTGGESGSEEGSVGGTGSDAKSNAGSDAPEVRVTNVRRVFHNGEHNAFTDMVRFRDRLYLTFRSCPDGHMVYPSSSIVVLRSEDGVDWEPVHRFAVEDRDTRDPHFLVFRDKLFLYTGTWYAGDPTEPRDLNLHLGYAVSTADGESWSEPVMLEGTFGHYVWRAASYDGVAYLCGRRKRNFAVGPRGNERPVESVMLVSDDGLVWRTGPMFQETEGNEVAFRFDDSGDVLAVARRTGSALWLRASPPYQEWERGDLGRYVGGPLLAKWGDRMVVGGRRQVADVGPRTTLSWLVDGKLVDFAELPSDGDNSYPGLIEIDSSRALVSWYSTHEKDESGEPITAIYLADLEIVE